MKKSSVLTLAITAFAFMFVSCEQTAEKAPQSVDKTAPESSELPDVQYVGYRVVHHMTLQTKHI